MQARQQQALVKRNKDFVFTLDELQARQELALPGDNTIFHRMQLVRNG